MKTHMDIVLKNFHKHECYEWRHADKSVCPVPNNLRGRGIIGGCDRLHVPHLKFAEEFENMVVTAGATEILSVVFKSGTQHTTWYVGLVGSSHSYAIGDTMGSHSGWTESQSYSESVRQTLTLGSTSGTSTVTCDNSASKAVFSINGTDTINGSFVVTNSTKGGTTGTLYGEGDYAASRGVASGDTLNVTITLTAAAA